ncbi:MAG: hypothetical protein JWQ21_3990 [Herminiimonas sp.]|nr:hypothetical protein [Herminiimonas sp.]
MTEEQIWQAITKGISSDGDSYINTDEMWIDITRQYSSMIADISERLSVKELTELISIGMKMYHKGMNAA